MSIVFRMLLHAVILKQLQKELEKVIIAHIPAVFGLRV